MGVTMSHSDNLRDRIAAVQRKHREELCEENVCICGHHGDYPTHVADAVIAELGLVEFRSDGERWWSTRFVPLEDAE